MATKRSASGSAARRGSVAPRRPSARSAAAAPAHDHEHDAGCDCAVSVKRSAPRSLGLVDYAQAAADALRAEFPDLVFTSGRRDSKAQARAMAGNVVRNRRWIVETYTASPQRAQLQRWVDEHPEARTAAQIGAGLEAVMADWSDAQKARLSRHFSGQAFDIHPVAGAQGTRIKAAIRRLPHLRKFLENEGGLVIWHADFEK